MKTQNKIFKEFFVMIFFAIVFMGAQCKDIGMEPNPDGIVNGGEGEKPTYKNPPNGGTPRWVKVTVEPFDNEYYHSSMAHLEFEEFQVDGVEYTMWYRDANKPIWYDSEGPDGLGGGRGGPGAGQYETYIRNGFVPNEEGTICLYIALKTNYFHYTDDQGSGYSDSSEWTEPLYIEIPKRTEETIIYEWFDSTTTP